MLNMLHMRTKREIVRTFAETLAKRALMQIYDGMPDITAPATEPPFASLIRRARAAGIPMKEVCALAEVAASTPSRWVAGTFEPRYSTIRKLEDALARLQESREAPATAEG